MPAPKSQHSAGKGLASVFYDLKCKTKPVIYHKDNAPCHKSLVSIHASYSSDFAPSDSYLFGVFKNMFKEMRFGSNEEVIAETEACFKTRD